MKLYSQLLSGRCCGGPVLAIAMLLIGFGILFQLLSASLLGLVFFSTGLLAEGLCLYLGLSRCHRQYD
ncbi:MAG: hypothetical protein KZQ80_08900 [Candidatus Thiodiazotropha sp. (ex Monitilora ramsayi)]|nr:hypothetical protein [Candidatus Thiodiazotropha sp. (ex Monitilora ramsayi)]